MATATNSVSAAIHNFIVYSGDTWSCTLTFTDASSLPMDFTGATIKMQVKKNQTGSSLLNFTLGGGITASGSTSNILAIKKIFSLPGGIYKYDLQVTYADGTVKTYLRGDITVIEDVTE